MRLNPGHTLGSIEIVSLLGSGGMGEVYRAHDTRLGRDVAIKVVGNAVAMDTEYLARFEREAKTLAALDHPNIGALYDFRTEDGTAPEEDVAPVHFLVMQLVEGESLATIIERDPIPLSEALPLFIQIARGLDAAHTAHIVHRDLKPDNVRVTPTGEVKILDFGIAKDTAPKEFDPSVSTTPMTSSPITGHGTVVGTPQYMSPEQTRGKPVDRRADVWAFGCCLYEALSGTKPFAGETSTDIVAAIMRDDPDWDKIAGIPARLLAILKRCLAKDVQQRYASLGDIAIQLEEIKDELNKPADVSQIATIQRDSTPAKTTMPLWTKAMAGAILLLAIAGTAFGLRAMQRQGADAADLIVAQSAINTIAVLPFENLAGGDSQDYFVNGMTHTLTAELGKIDSLVVKARASALRFKNTVLDPSEIAEQLGVDGLVTGSIQRSEEEVLISAYLIDGRSNDQIWAENFSGPVENILQLQGDIAIGIAEKLGAAIAPDQRAEFEQADYVNAAAWEFYLQAREAFRVRTVEGFEKAIDLLKGAVAADSEFGDAHALLALVYSARPLNFTTADFEEDFANAKEHGRIALDLDPGSLDARFALSWAAMPGDWDFETAARYRREALEIDPDNAYAQYAYGWWLRYTGRLHEADEYLRKAIELDPQLHLYHQERGNLMIKMGRYEDADKSFSRARELAPDTLNPRINHAVALALLGQGEEAIDAFEDPPDTPRAAWYHYRARVFAELGMMNEAEEEYMKHRELFPDLLPPADVLVLLGREEEALDARQKAFEERQLGAELDLFDNPQFNRFWEHPRYWKLRFDHGFPMLPVDHPAYEYQQEYMVNKRVEEVMKQRGLTPIEED